MTGMRKRFEIWLANLDPARGTEVGKVRPVIIIQTDLLQDSLESTLICPITTRESNSEILKVKIKPTPESGINESSWVVVDQIRAIDNRRFIQKIGELPKTYKEKLNQSLKIILDLI